MHDENSTCLVSNQMYIWLLWDKNGSVEGCEQSWTAFVDKYLDGFTLKTRHFQSLKVVM